MATTGDNTFSMDRFSRVKYIIIICNFILAFILMIVMASVQLLQNGSKGSPAAADLRGFGSLFGVAVRKWWFYNLSEYIPQVYAFMCHHSIPGLVTPIRDKANLSTKLISVYSMIYLFYCALSMTGTFAFEHVQDIYTINFLVFFLIFN